MSEELETQGPRKLSMAALSGTLDGANYALQSLRDKCIKLAQQHQDRRFWIHQISTDMNELQEKLAVIREHLDAETATAMRLELAQVVDAALELEVIPTGEASDVAKLITQLESQGYVVLTAGERDEQSSASKDEAKKEEDSAAGASAVPPVGTAISPQGGEFGAGSEAGSALEQSSTDGLHQTTTTATTNDTGTNDGNGAGTTTNSPDSGTTTDSSSRDTSSTSTLPDSGTVGLSTASAKPKATLGNRVLGK